jgi:hypothetical protein
MRGFLVCLVVLATLCACADAKGRLFEKPIAFPDQLVGRLGRISIESLMVCTGAATACVCSLSCRCAWGVCAT